MNLKENVNLIDKLSRRNFASETGNKEPLFPLHLSPAEIHDGIKNGKLYQGSFLASRDNFLEAQVNIEGRDKPVSIT